MFDIKAVQEVSSATVEILHPITKERLGASIELAGPEHPARKKIVLDRQRKLRAGFAKKGRIDFNDPLEDEEEEIEFFAASTLGWSGFSEDGKEIKFSKEAAIKLYSSPELTWLKAQVREALDNRENFISG